MWFVIISWWEIISWLGEKIAWYPFLHRTANKANTSTQRVNWYLHTQ